jgi:hypothetical protein
MFADFAHRALAETTDDTGLWTGVFATGDLNHHKKDGKWRWWFDGQMRFFHDDDGFGQSLVRPGVGYKLTDKLTVWSGYAWIHTASDPSPPTDEHRIWEQVTWSHDFEPTTLNLRSRLEQRFMETGDDVALRFRQSVGLHRPMSFAPKFAWVVSDEVFFNLNDTDSGTRAGLDQNRAFLGVGWKPSPERPWRLEVGYLNQFIDHSTGDYTSNHLLSLNLHWNP